MSLLLRKSNHCLSIILKNSSFVSLLDYFIVDAANPQPSNTPNAAAPKEFDPLSAKEDGSRNKVASSFGLQEGKL